MIRVNYLMQSFMDAPITDESRSNLESMYGKAIQVLGQNLDLTRLDCVVITANLSVDVHSFQIANGYASTGMTNNDNATAKGKTLRNKKSGFYTIFLDADYACWLLERDFLDSIINDYDTGTKEYYYSLWSFARNLAVHELNHVDFETRYRKPSFNPFYVDSMKSLSWNLIDEFYAYANAAKAEYALTSKEFADMVRQSEVNTLSLISKYHRGMIDDETTMNRFMEYMRFALNSSMAAIAIARSAESTKPELSECIFSKYVNQIDNLLIEDSHSLSEELILDYAEELSHLLISYHQDFGVHVQDFSDGTQGWLITN